MKEMMRINMKIVAEVRDGKTGKVKDRKIYPCHTFLKNFSNVAVLLFSRGDTITNRTVVDLGGTNRTVRNNSSQYVIGDYGANPSYKAFCRIGTNNQAFNRDDYDVITYLAEIAYSEYNIEDDGTQKLLKITFGWTNDTGVSKDVYECLLGIYYMDSGGVIRKIGISRDVFSPAITVPNGDVLALGYWITIPW